ncbi:hypothetical protein [Nostoc sp. JL34]|nr:hypothetical protein [Nostoc sp. JL34]
MIDWQNQMIYQTYQPRSPLSQFVELLWSREGENLPNALLLLS